MWEITIALVVGILTLVCLYLTWNFDYWQKRGIRGPKPKILVGNFEKTRRGECNFVEELHDIYLNYKSTDRFVGIFTARTPKLFILDPALAVQILTTNFSSFHDNEASMWTTSKIDKLRFTSPIACNGNVWKQRRLQLGPTSSLNMLRYFQPVMSKMAINLSEFIKGLTTNIAIDINELSRKYTAEVMADYIFGISVDDFKDDKPSAIQEASSSIIHQALKCINYYYGQTAAWPWWRKIRPVRFFPESEIRFFTHLIREVKKLREENPNDRPDVFNYLLKLQTNKRISKTDFIGYSITVLIDGFETAAITLSHCLLLLGRSKSAQDKLRKEILQNLNTDDYLSFNNLNELPYLDQCVYETLRLFPPLPTFFKICTAPIELENSDGTKIRLQAGDKVYISNYSFQHDEEFFENAEDFIPERFDPDLGGIQHYRKMGVLLPFGDGPRMCQGMKLALLEIKIALTDILRKFEISVCPTTRSDNRTEPNSFLLCLMGGVRLILKPVSEYGR